MNTILKHTLLGALASTLSLAPVISQAQTSAERVYVIDARNEVAKSGTNLCWRTGYWTPASAANDPAGCACDKDLLAKEKCTPKTAQRPTAPQTPPKETTAKPLASKVTLAADTLFDFNKAVLRPEGKKKLDEMAVKAKDLNLEVIIAVGHTDRIGSDSYNQKLSENRAAAVKTYLVSKGIDANKIYTEGKGKKQPVTKPDQCVGPKSKKVIDCLEPDRRVDIEIIGTQK